MENKNVEKMGTSLVPLIAGIIGAVIIFPPALCAGMLARTLITELSGMGLLLSCVLGIIGAIFSRRKPMVAGILMLVAACLSIISIISIPFHFIILGTISLLVGAIFCFIQKKVEIK